MFVVEEVAALGFELDPDRLAVPDRSTIWEITGERIDRESSSRYCNSIPKRTITSFSYSGLYSKPLNLSGFPSSVKSVTLPAFPPGILAQSGWISEPTIPSCITLHKQIGT